MADTTPGTFRPGVARLALGPSPVFGGGGQPISGAGGIIPDPTGLRALDRFLAYATSKPGAWFAREDTITDWAMTARAGTPVHDRGPSTVSGLQGSAA